MATFSTILILAGLVGLGYVGWRIVRRGRGRGNPDGHPWLRVAGVPTMACLLAGGILAPVEESTEADTAQTEAQGTDAKSAAREREARAAQREREEAAAREQAERERAEAKRRRRATQGETGRVTRVIDGDTVDPNRDLGKTVISSRILRFYYYQMKGDENFDSGLLTLDGFARGNYYTYRCRTEQGPTAGCT